MILSLLIFFFLLLLIYTLSRRLVSQLYRLAGLELLSFLLLPGIVIHELSHMLVAELMFVKTGKFSFTPEIGEDNEVRFGQLAVTITDPLRRTLIGLAPLFVSLAIIGAVFNFYLFPQVNPPAKLLNYSVIQLLIILVIGYLLSVISLTMFSSKKDLEKAIIPAVILTIIIIVLYLAGFQLTVPKKLIDWLASLLNSLNRALVLVLILDLVGFFSFRLISGAVSQLLRRRAA